MPRKFSFSKLTEFDNCPLKYKLHYIDRISVVKRYSPELILGQAVHHVLSQLYQAGADGVLIPEDDAIKAYHTQWGKYPVELIVPSRDFYTVDDYIRLGEEMLRKHYGAYQPFREGTLLGSEMGLSYNIPDTDFALQGYIDRLVRRDDGVVEICDYKTSQHVSRPSDTSFRVQMGIYQLMVEQNYPYKEIEVCQHFLRRDEIVRHRMTEEELDVLQEELKTLIWAVIDAERLDNFPAREGWMCNFCDFHSHCPTKRHQLALEGELDEDEPPVPSADQIKEMTDRYLELDRQAKSAKTEMDSLKQEFRRLADTEGLQKLIGDTGELKITLSRSEKFVTAYRDGKRFARLSQLARAMDLEAYFKLDGNALMKEVVRKHRLTEEQMAELAEFIESDESMRVVTKHTPDSRED